jgi:alpha-1,2-mannosyltransferase
VLTGTRRRAVVLMMAGVALAIAVPTVWHSIAVAAHRMVDLDVYRDAGRSVLIERPVYEHITLVEWLPFTYPPFAALLSVPLAWLPVVAGRIAWTAMNLGLLAFILWRVARPAWARLGPVFGPLLFGAAVWLLPVRDTIRYGQVNLILVALILLDCTVERPRWPRGLLIGLATAIKLTPGLFIPFLWFSGRRRAAVVAAASAAGFTLVTWAVLPNDSVTFWTEALWNPGRLGRNSGTPNQALRGILLRAPIGPTLGVVLAAALAFFVIVGLRRATDASRRGDEIAAIAIVGLTSVLVSPVSWIHHMVWVVLAAAVIAGDLRDRRRVLTAVALLALFVTRAPYIGAHAVYHWTVALQPLWWVMRNSFGLAAAVVVLRMRARDAGELQLVELPAGSGTAVDVADSGHELDDELDSLTESESLIGPAGGDRHGPIG